MPENSIRLNELLVYAVEKAPDGLNLNKKTCLDMIYRYENLCSNIPITTFNDFLQVFDLMLPEVERVSRQDFIVLREYEVPIKTYILNLFEKLVGR